MLFIFLFFDPLTILKYIGAFSQVLNVVKEGHDAMITIGGVFIVRIAIFDALFIFKTLLLSIRQSTA